MQFATWVLLPLLMAQFFICVSPVVPNISASVLLSLLFGGFGLASAYFGYKVSIVDPIDKRLQRHLIKQQKTEEEQLKSMNGNGGLSATHTHAGCKGGEEEEDDDNETKFCWVCQTRVHLLSMHCKFCDKCVGHFDHHCQWLNTCVGAANYKYFFSTLCSLALFLSTHAATSIYVVVSFFIQWTKVRDGNTNNNTTATYDRMTTVYGGGAGFALAVIILFFVVFVIFFAILIVQLCVFHIALQKKQITTYEYIVRDNALKREKAKERREILDLRRMRVMEARRNGQTLKAYSFMAGQYCLPTCDPIQRELDEQKDSPVVQASSSNAAAAVNGSNGHVSEERNGTTAMSLNSEEAVNKNENSVVMEMQDSSEANGYMTHEEKEEDEAENDEDNVTSSILCLADGNDTGALREQEHQIDFISMSTSELRNSSLTVAKRNLNFAEDYDNTSSHDDDHEFTPSEPGSPHKEPTSSAPDSPHQQSFSSVPDSPHDESTSSTPTSPFPPPLPDLRSKLSSSPKLSKLDSPISPPS
jgi:hypothetical protein